MAHQQLTFLHRQFIARLLAEGRKHTFIADVLEVHRSTISRELKRNTLPGKPYCPHTAQRMADSRHRIHAHKGVKPAFLSRPNRLHDRERELGLRWKKHYPPLRSEKRKAWERFCSRWKRPLPALKKESFRLRLWKKEGFRFRLRNPVAVYRKGWSFRFQRHSFRSKKSGLPAFLKKLSLPEASPAHTPDVSPAGIKKTAVAVKTPALIFQFHSLSIPDFREKEVRFCPFIYQPVEYCVSIGQFSFSFLRKPFFPIATPKPDSVITGQPYWVPAFLSSDGRYSKK